MLFFQDLLEEETASMVQSVGSETLRECKNEELKKRLDQEAEINAAEEISDELIEDVARYIIITAFWYTTVLCY